MHPQALPKPLGQEALCRPVARALPFSSATYACCIRLKVEIKKSNFNNLIDSLTILIAQGKGSKKVLFTHQAKLSGSISCYLL
jgi:hypothetical protein